MFVEVLKRGTEGYVAPSHFVTEEVRICRGASRRARPRPARRPGGPAAAVPRPFAFLPEPQTDLCLCWRVPLPQIPPPRPFPTCVACAPCSARR